MRTFEKTHPWLVFEVDLRKVPADLWLALGECKSKIWHIGNIPLRPDVAREMHQVYLVRGALATTAIEGNTLTEDEVNKLLEKKLQLPPSREYLAQEVMNIVEVCNLIVKDAEEQRPLVISEERIKKFNEFVLFKLAVDEGVVPGELRKHEVGVGRYKGAPWKDCSYLLERLCQWLNEDRFNHVPGGPLAGAILKAVLAHLYLAWIHPFGDGNGRTGRLLEFQILVAAGAPVPTAHLLSDYYNLTRNEYYRHLDQASKTPEGVILFLQYAIRGFLEGLQGQIEDIVSQQMDVAWRSYVQETFRDKPSVAQNRRRDLVLDLSRQKGPVPLKTLAFITPRTTELYAKKTRKTLTRDVNALIRMGLLRRTKEGISPCKELMHAFLPFRACD